MTSIFGYSKNYGSLTHETTIKDAVNIEDRRPFVPLKTIPFKHGRQNDFQRGAIFAGSPKRHISANQIWRNSATIVLA